MTNLPYIEQELEKFGLSQNQAKIYMLLVAHKELRIQEIATLAGIPRSSVYENLKALYQLSLAEEVVGDSYKKIRPYPISVIRHELDEQVLRFQKLKNDLDKLEKAITFAPSTDLATTSVRYYKGRAGARQLYWNTLKATDIVYVYSDWGRGVYLGMKYYENFVAESRRRNIQEKVLINPTAHALDSIRTYSVPGSPISRANIETIRAVDESTLLIKGDALIYDNVYAQAYLKNVEINGFEIENSLFTAMQRSIHETIWETARPIAELL